MKEENPIKKVFCIHVGFDLYLFFSILFQKKKKKTLAYFNILYMKFFAYSQKQYIDNKFISSLELGLNENVYLIDITKFSRNPTFFSK
jgi:hypothetical protein